MTSYFVASVGTEQAAQTLRQAVGAHAAWLDMASDFHRESCRNHLVFALGRLYQGAELAAVDGEDDSIWRFGTPSCYPLDTYLRPAADGSGTVNAARTQVEVSKADGGILAATPLCTPERLYWARLDDGWIVGNDIRLLIRITGREVDPAGMCAMLRHGAGIFSITVDRRIQCLRPGHVCRLSPDGAAPTVEPIFTFEPPPGGDPSQADDIVRRCLDEQVAAIPTGSVLGFSGGVDSALIAARALEMGRRDLVLVNCAFGDDDAEAVHAARVADALGLECTVIPFDPAGAADALDRIATEFMYPFDDTATLATNLIAQEAIKIVGAGSTVVDGTGADCAFGEVGYYNKWNPVYAVPAFLRRLSGRLAGTLRSYRHRWKDSSLHKTLSVMRRAAVLSQCDLVAIYNNGLEGIVYDVPDEIDERLRTEIREVRETLFAGLDPISVSALLTLVHFCGGACASKIHHSLRRKGVRAMYPYMAPRVLEVAFGLTWEQKSTGGEPKDVLKRILAETLPRELIYRTKSGLDTPLHDLWTAPEVPALLEDVLLGPSNELLEFVRRDVLEDIAGRMIQGRPVSFEATRTFWNLTMASLWDHQLRQATES